MAPVSVWRWRKVAVYDAAAGLPSAKADADDFLKAFVELARQQAIA
ncbi:MAG: hypothetical protein M0Z99_09325 [Betaproteobacteria bacterium]|nr:hypothetical protein [Betaproteobacteria bacterium]